MSDTKGRLNLALGDRSLERLDRLKDKTEATSSTEVIKNALRLYEVLVDEVEKRRKEGYMAFDRAFH